MTWWDAYLGQAHLWFTSKWDMFAIIQHDQAGLYEIPKTQEAGVEAYMGAPFSSVG